MTLSDKLLKIIKKMLVLAAKISLSVRRGIALNVRSKLDQNHFNQLLALQLKTSSSCKIIPFSALYKSISFGNTQIGTQKFFQL